MLVTPNLKGWWRFEGDANDASGQGNHGTVVGATNWINQVPIMTSNILPAGEASASTEYSATYAAWKAFNRTNVDSEDAWASAKGDFPHWLQYEFEEAQEITKYAITTRNHSVPDAPRSWVLYGSNTGAFAGEEDTLDTQVDGFPSNTQNERREFEISTPDSYKYYRLHITVGWRNDLVIVGMLELLNQQGKFGKCYSFDGDDDRIEIPAMAMSTNPYTVCGWIKLDSSWDSSGALAGGNAPGELITCGVDADKKLYNYNYAEGSSASFSGTTVLDTDVWYFATYTRTGDSGKVFLNGKEDGSGSLRSGDCGSFRGVGYTNNYDFYFNGLIDEPQIYSKALSQSDIKRIMMLMHPLGG